MGPGPLTGYTVGITGDRRWEEQAEMLTHRGAQVVHGPVMRTTLLNDTDATLRATEAALAGGVDVVVLSTGIGTRSWFAAAESAGLDGDLRSAGLAATVLARGPKARSAAIGAGLDVHWQAEGETGAEIVRHLAAAGVAGRRVLVQRDGGAPVLADAVRSLGADVVDVPVYRWHPVDDDAPARRLLDAAVAGRLHAVTFTCAYAVASAFALADDPGALARALGAGDAGGGGGGAVRAVAVGPVTAAALRRHGVDRAVEPRRARLGAMVQALVTVLSADHRTLGAGDDSVRWQGGSLLAADGTVTTLTPGEERVLRELARRAPAVVPKAALVDERVDPHAGEAAVARLRTKLGPLGAGIRAVPRRGYACDLPVTPAPPAPTSPRRATGASRSRPDRAR